MRLPPLNAIKAFETVGRLQSVKKAAQALHVTPAAVSHQLKVLEEALGVKLFHRENRAIRLTEAGARGLDDVTAGFALLGRGVGRIKQQNEANVLVVSAGPAFSISWLVPRLHDFIQQYPQYDARVSSNTIYSDFVLDGVDIAIRFGNAPADDLYSIHLSEEWVIPMYSPQLKLDSIADLTDKTLIHDHSMEFAQQQPDWAHWLDAAGADVDLAEHGLHFNQADHALQAAVDGNGVVLGRFVLAAQSLLAGRLIASMGPAIKTGFSFYLISPVPFEEKPTVLAFTEWLQAIFAADIKKAATLVEGLG